MQQQSIPALVFNSHHIKEPVQNTKPAKQISHKL